MKIIHFVSSFSRGGKERQLLTIYRNNQKKDHKIKLLYINERSPNYLGEFDIQKEDLLRIQSKNFLWRMMEAWRIIKKEKPDVVYAWGTLEAAICLIIRSIHGFIFINGSIRHGIFSREASKYFRSFLLYLSRNVVANSYAGLKANGLKTGFVLYNGIDDKFFHTTPISSDVLSFKEKIHYPLLISVANMVPYKDYFTIFRALVKLKQHGFSYSYVIIGDGPMRNKLKSCINRSGLNDCVYMLGSMQYVEEWFSISDVFIHSSRGEGCSNAILEAMASGLPIIATNVGGTPEVVEPDFGFLFEYKNDQELLLVLERLLSAPPEILKMGEKARAKALEKFTIQSMMKSYYQIIDDITIQYK